MFFAFGIVMWELLTWELPWTGMGEWQIVASRMAGIRPEVPQASQLAGQGVFPQLENYVAIMQRC
jgi:hypothetical protein